ncbi:MAG: hypothetical protein ACJA2S_004813 [Cyclobacteriaceae bacterium]|jgi:hypothetical protein
MAQWSIKRDYLLNKLKRDLGSVFLIISGILKSFSKYELLRFTTKPLMER